MLEKENSFMRTYDRVLKLLSGRKVLVVSCGPSAVRWREFYGADPNDRPVVICIKQAVELVDVPVDIHIFNQFNLRRYRSKNGTVCLKILGVSESERRPFWFVKRDIDFYVRGGGHWDDTVCARGIDEDSMAEALTLNRSGVQNWGPGVMHEFVLPLLLASEVTAVDIVGWDIADANGDNTHFDEEIRTRKTSKVKHSAAEVNASGTINLSRPMADLLFLRQRLRSIQYLKQIVWFFRSVPLAFRYAARKKLNEAGMMTGEAEAVSRSVHVVKKLFEKADKNLRVHTDSRWLQSAD
jgi:hypothetical protein